MDMLGLSDNLKKIASAALDALLAGVGPIDLAIDVALTVFGSSD